MSAMAQGPPERAFIGGVWSGTATSTIWPLARLEIHVWGLRVRGSVPGLRWLAPAWEAGYDQLTQARLVHVPVASRGVFLQAGPDVGPLVFWTRRGAEILDRLQVHGVSVDHTVARLPWGGNLHHP